MTRTRQLRHLKNSLYAVDLQIKFIKYSEIGCTDLKMSVHFWYTDIYVIVVKEGSELKCGYGTGGNVIKPMRIVVRPAYRDEWEDAMSLAWRTFMQFEAQDYTPEGIESFQEFITDTVLYRMFVMGAYQLFGAYDNGRMIGMISLRNETHISLLFVDGKYHKMGIGTRLIEYISEYVLNEEGHRNITVNAAPYATGFYHRIGFVDTDSEQTSDGIRYTPMERSIK